MSKKSRTTERFTGEKRVEERFLQGPDSESFADLFNTFTPQLVDFFRSRKAA